MTRNKLTILTVAIIAFGLVGCSQSKVAAIYKQDNAQLALALNKDGSVSVIGVGDGVRVKPCEIPGGQNPDEAAIAKCFPDGHVPGKILFQQNYTISVREGSLCITVVVNGKIYVLCNPPYNISYTGN